MMWEQFMSDDLSGDQIRVFTEVRMDDALRCFAVWTATTTTTTTRTSDINPQSGLLPPLGNTTPAEVWEAVLSAGESARSMQGFRLRSKGGANRILCACWACLPLKVKLHPVREADDEHCHARSSRALLWVCVCEVVSLVSSSPPSS